MTSSFPEGELVAVDLYFDVVCPYAYLASTQLEGLLAGTSARLHLRPILLGGVFREIGQADDPNRTMSAARAEHGRRDLARWADRFGVPLRMPAAHPRRSVLAMRALTCCVAQAPRVGGVAPTPRTAVRSRETIVSRSLSATSDAQDLHRGMQALFDAYWVRGEDIADPAVVASALRRADLPGDELVARAGTPAIKDALFATTREAAGRGVFGVPTFVVSRPGHAPELFWGQDRLDWVRERLESA